MDALIKWLRILKTRIVNAIFVHATSIKVADTKNSSNAWVTVIYANSTFTAVIPTTTSNKVMTSSDGHLWVKKRIYK